MKFIDQGHTCMACYALTISLSRFAAGGTTFTAITSENRALLYDREHAVSANNCSLT
jgi:hypothetical protein